MPTRRALEILAAPVFPTTSGSEIATFVCIPSRATMINVCISSKYVSHKSPPPSNPFESVRVWKFRVVERKKRQKKILGIFSFYNTGKTFFIPISALCNFPSKNRPNQRKMCDFTPAKSTETTFKFSLNANISNYLRCLDQDYNLR